MFSARDGDEAFGGKRNFVRLHVFHIAWDDFLILRIENEAGKGRKRDYKPAMRNERILPRHGLGCDNTLAARRKSPTTRAKRFIQYAPIFNLGKIDDAIGFYLDVV